MRVCAQGIQRLKGIEKKFSRRLTGAAFPGVGKAENQNAAKGKTELPLQFAVLVLGWQLCSKSLTCIRCDPLNLWSELVFTCVKLQC